MPTSTGASTGSGGIWGRSSASSPTSRWRATPPAARVRCRTSPAGTIPMSVQVHAELVQALAGNAVVAKTPSQGGFHALTLAHALMRRAGLPVTLLSGMGSQMGEVLIRSEGIGALVFVGGRANGRRAAVVAGRHRSTAHARAGGAQRLGHLGVLAVGPPGPAHAQGVRVRQAALHGLSPLCRPAPPVPGLPGDVPAGGATSVQFGNPLAVEQPGRPAARTRLRAGHPCRQGRRALGAVRRGGARRRHPALPGLGRRRTVPRRTGHLGLRRPVLRPAAAGRRGRSITPSRSARWTRSWSSTPRPSCWPP